MALSTDYGCLRRRLKRAASCQCRPADHVKDAETTPSRYRTITSTTLTSQTSQNLARQRSRFVVLI
jgi:hypothetical protein